MPSYPVHVAVGVLFDSKQRVLLAKRGSHQHQGELWEFPGGKVEFGESVFAALQRELKEELGIHIISAQPLIEIKHDYKDKAVVLDTWRVTAFSGEPQGLEGQPIAWVAIHELKDYSFPEANLAIIQRLLEP